MPCTTSLCSFIFLNLRHHGLYVVYMFTCVSDVASFITTNEQIQLNWGCYFPMQTMLPGAFSFFSVESFLTSTLLGNNCLWLKPQIHSEAFEILLFHCPASGCFLNCALSQNGPLSFDTNHARSGNVLRTKVKYNSKEQ